MADQATNSQTAASSAAQSETEKSGAEEENEGWDTLKPLMKRYWPVLAITWILHLGLGLCISITGPTLPYLAVRTRESLANVSFVYTVRSIVVCLTSIATGFLLAKFTSSRSKLILLFGGSALSAAYALLTPFADSLATLILAQCLFGIGAGIYDTGMPVKYSKHCAMGANVIVSSCIAVDNMLVIYLFGPVLSRSFSHSLHFCVGLGGFLAPLLARPFLVEMGDIGLEGDVCGGSRNSSVGNSTVPSVVNLEPLKWPYIIVGCLHAIWLLGYVVLLAVNFQLDKFRITGSSSTTASPDAPEPAVPVSSPRMSRRRQVVVVSLFVIFYILHVGQENVFWSLLYSFGVCSPHLRMLPGEASTLSTVFFVGFLISRATGIVIARFLRPSVILLIQLSGCLVATVLLAIWGEASVLMAYLCCGFYGFCIAMVFPTGITWLASKLEVTGALSSAWFIGAYVGISTYPVAAGQLIGSPAGPISIMYMAAGTSAVYLGVVGAMFSIAR